MSSASVLLKVRSALEGGERGDQYLVAARASSKAGNNAAPATGMQAWTWVALRTLNVKISSYYPLSGRSLTDMSTCGSRVNSCLYNPTSNRSLSDMGM